jgi:hypothetical protein
MTSAALLLRPDGNAVCAGVIYGAEYAGSAFGHHARCCIGIICPSSSIELFIREGGSMQELFVQTLQPELAAGIAAGCMRVAAAKMFVVNSAIGICCLGIERTCLQQFCEGVLENSVFVSTARGLSHTSTLCGGSGLSIPHDCYTCEGAWLWQRYGCFVDNSTMQVRCVRPLLLPGVPITSRGEVQALLLPAAMPAKILDNGGWACGTALPCLPAVVWMEQELAMTVDSIDVSRHNGVPGDFFEAITPALSLKADCVFFKNVEHVQQSPVKAIRSSRSAALACAMRLSDLILNDASSENEPPGAPQPQSSDTCEQLCSLMLRCSQRSRTGQRLWDMPDCASLNSKCSDIQNASTLWPVGCRALAGAIIAVLVAARGSSGAKYPLAQSMQHCSWGQVDLCLVSSYEAANFAPINLGGAHISSVISALLQFCGHAISNWRPQPSVDFNEGLLLLQMMCGGYPPESVMCTGMLHRLLEFALMLLGIHAIGPTLGGDGNRYRQKQQQTSQNDEFQEKFKQFESALECSIGICCNAIEVLHVRFGSLTCRISASHGSQLLNISLASRLLDEIISSPIKGNALLAPFAQELSSILRSAQNDTSVAPLFEAFSHAFALIAASSNASRGSFTRSCAVSGFVRMFLNSIDEMMAPSLQGNGCSCVSVCNQFVGSQVVGASFAES